MGIDRKYGTVTLEHGSVGDDEPVFVFRAQDGLTTLALRHYQSLCRESGSPYHHLEGIGDAIAEFLRWQATHDTRVPTSKSREA
jgi:hypothetical protein